MILDGLHLDPGKYYAMLQNLQHYSLQYILAQD